MARTLGDVLHLFIGEEEPGGAARAPGLASEPAPETRAGPTAGRRIVTCIADNDETLASAIAWNLAAANAALGARTTWISTEASLWAPPASAPPALEQIRAGRASDALAWAARAATDSVWLHLAPDRVAGAELLGHVLLFACAEPDAIARCIDRMESVLERAPDSELSVLVHGVRSAAEGRSTFGRLAEAASGPLGRAGPVYEAGVLVDDLEVYRSLVSRRPVCRAAPDSRAAAALFQAARQLSRPQRPIAGSPG